MDDTGRTRNAARAVQALVVVVVFCAAAPPVGANATARCLRASGAAGARCLRDYARTIAACRIAGDVACENAARAPGGALDAIRARTAPPSEKRCTDERAGALGYPSKDDLLVRVPEACTDFGEDLLALSFAADPGMVPMGALDCQRRVAMQVRRLDATVVARYGPSCFLRNATGNDCNRTVRDAAVAEARANAHRRILATCGDEFDFLALGAGATLEARIDELLDRVVTRARHYAERVYPPNDLGLTAEFGPHPIGVRTLALNDPSRLDANGVGTRPVTVEVYYPSTPAAVAGVPRDVAQVLGIDIVATPAFRDVERAAGAFPLILFSHGNNGIRFQSFFFAAHLASHGFVVATPDHHGNTFVDTLLGVVDVDSAVNRPRDLSFLIDQLTAFNGEAGHFLEGAIAVDRIGVSGHSFGGYTSFAVAGGTFALGTFTDPRVDAILPQAPAALPFPDEFFGTITVPTLIVGGSIDETTPFVEEQQRPFDLLPSGASVVALAALSNGGHFTFSDFCEVPRDLLGFLGGFDEACEPRHLPWRHAHDIVNYLSLNFFDAILNVNADALARLAPATVATIEELAVQRK